MTPQTPSRRTVVTIAAAAPSLAASHDPTPAHDLHTSVTSGGTRTSATNLNISPTNFINTGTETVEGITVIFVASGVQTITGISVFNTDIKNLVAGATTPGYGTNTVVLTLPPGTGLGQVTIPRTATTSRRRVRTSA